MSWFNMGRNGGSDAGDTIAIGDFYLPTSPSDTDHANYADELQAGPDDQYPMGSVDNRTDLRGIWPKYVRSQEFKAEFEDIGDVIYPSEFAGMGYRNDINQDIGGETGASNAFPYWSSGPVTGHPSQMTGEFPHYSRINADGGYGDVKGAGSDYGRQLAAAYYQDAVAGYATAYAEAGLMAAI